MLMSMSHKKSEFEAMALLDPERPTPPILLSRAQRRALAQICKLHEQGVNGRWLSRRSLMFTLYIAFNLVFSVLLLNMTAFAPAGYLFLGFVLGAHLKDLKTLVVIRRFWPVYDVIIDWPRAFHILKKSGESREEQN